MTLRCLTASMFSDTMVKCPGHTAAAVCMHFSSKPALKQIHWDCARVKFSAGQWRDLQCEKSKSSVIPEVMGLPLCHPQSPPMSPPKAPQTVVSIICLSVALLLSRQRGDEGIYCRLERRNTNPIRQTRIPCILSSPTGRRDSNWQSFYKIKHVEFLFICLFRVNSELMSVIELTRWAKWLLCKGLRNEGIFCLPQWQDHQCPLVQ